MRAPAFWNKPGIVPAILAPTGVIYALVTALRQAFTKAWSAPVPVICIGNAVAGGAGKTPVALSVAALLTRMGHKPYFLTRGYGGRLRGPVSVEPGRHKARDVGDESLLLAAGAPTIVAADRRAGVALAVQGGADVVVMDDGLQNPTIAKDLSLLVIDGGFGFGNYYVMPAGPLREPLAQSMKRADAVVIVGPDRTEALRDVPEGLPILEARIAPSADTTLAGKRVLAFAGIGRPQKFVDTLRDMGCDIAGAYSFPDHHRYDPNEIMGLIEIASAKGAEPVTTMKDFVRLPDEAKPMVQALKIMIEWRDGAALETLVARHVD